MVKGPTRSEDSAPPNEFAQATPRDLHPTSDIRFVMVETAKLASEIKGLDSAVKDHGSDIKELRKWIIGGIVALGAIGCSAVIWANAKFEHDAEQLSELSKTVAVMQVQNSAAYDDIKEIKDAVTHTDDKKAAQ